MTIERAILVRMSQADGDVAALVADLRATRARAGKALPGDRVDIVRYEAVSTQLEQLAHVAWLSGNDAVAVPIEDGDGHVFIDEESLSRRQNGSTILARWCSAGDIAVELRLPTSTGRAEPTSRGGVATQPAERWEAPPGVGGTRAVALRFRQQLEAAAASRGSGSFSPSGVSNGVITEALREFTNGDGSGTNATVVYRDGSTARDYPLRSLRLRDTLADAPWTILRFSLLSLRHVEMDVEVDGAWLRNTDISRARPVGETDELAYQISRNQLMQLCRDGQPILLNMYQTGLQPAVVGFYRAVAHHMAAHPGSLAVLPMFFRSTPPNEARRQVAGYVQETHFAEGTPWTT